jgi:predicted 3-demethylubiquinone-9 3-methyltransferase (glyoxalase superfamily)
MQEHADALFDGNAEEAVQFYLSVFKDGKSTRMTRFPEGSPGDNTTARMTAAAVMIFMLVS